MPKLHRSLLGVLLMTLSPAMAACNALTGADDLVIAGAGPDGSDGDKGPGPGDLTPDAPRTPNTPTEASLLPATGVTIRELALYQGVKRQLMVDGARIESDTPIVRGRDALLRVFFETDAGYNGAPVTARLELDGQAPVELVGPLPDRSSDNNLKSTINFDLPAAAMVPGLSYRIALLQPKEQSKGESPAAVFPASGAEPLDVDPTESVIHIEIVPLQYGADGSNRSPDTTEQQLKQFEERFHALYPVSRVDLTVRNPVRYPDPILADGTGWGELLDSLAAFRNDENPADNTYYYGVFSPAPTLQEFCDQGCVAGLGFVSNPADVNSRVAIGLGYGGEVASETLVHEIGHTHGRAHAPCGGVDGADPGFPYAGGSIGSWGYDLVKKQLLAPDETSDMMGYCTPTWVSDYTFKALFDRVRFVGGASVVIPEAMRNRRYDRVRIDARGNARFLPAVTMRRPPMAETRTVVVESSAGTESVSGQYYRYDHVAGGLMYIPETSRPIRSVRMEIGGRQISVAR